MEEYLRLTRQTLMSCFICNKQYPFDNIDIACDAHLICKPCRNGYGVRTNAKYNKRDVEDLKHYEQHIKKLKLKLTNKHP